MTWPTETRGTPYAAVTTAIQILKDLRSGELPDDEDDGLVVFTDGEFDELERNPTPSPQLMSDHLKGLRSHEIIQARYEIATLITGRDPEPDASNLGLVSSTGRAQDGYPVINVETELPLRRLVMFHQADIPTGLKVVGPSSSFADGGSPRPVLASEPLQITAGNLRATITTITSADPHEVLGRGAYSVAIDASVAISPSAIRFLPEVALGLDLGRDDGPATHCEFEKIDVRAAIANSVSGLRVDLERIGRQVICAGAQAHGVRDLIEALPAAEMLRIALMATLLGALGFFLRLVSSPLVTSDDGPGSVATGSGQESLRGTIEGAAIAALRGAAPTVEPLPELSLWWAEQADRWPNEGAVPSLTSTPARAGWRAR